MEVRHERPSPDTQFRVTAPLILGLADGDSLQVRQWTLRAVHDERLIGRDLAGVVMSIPFQGVNIYFPVTLLPGDAPDEFVFDGLTGRQRETLALFYRNLLSGRMASAADVITALDTPVDLVPMGETDAERKSGMAGKASPAARTAVHLAGYAAAFLLVFGFLGSLVWSRLSYLDATSAYVLDQTKVVAGDPFSVPGAALTVVAQVEPDLALEVWAGMTADVTYVVDGAETSLQGRVKAVLTATYSATRAIDLVIVPDAAANTDGQVLPPDQTPVKVKLARDRWRRFFGMRSDPVTQ